MVHVQGFLVINRNDTIEFICIEKRFFGSDSVVFVFSEVVFYT